MNNKLVNYKQKNIVVSSISFTENIKKNIN